MPDKLVDPVQEFLHPYGMFLVPETPGDGITTKRGGRVYLTHTPDGLQTRITRPDGPTILMVHRLPG